MLRPPPGSLRSADFYRRRFPCRDAVIRTNVAYHLIHLDLLAWLLRRVDLWGTAREMLVKTGLVTTASVCEALLFDAHAARGVADPERLRKWTFSNHIDHARAGGVIDVRLESSLHALRKIRNRLHLEFLVEPEYERYVTGQLEWSRTILEELRLALYEPPRTPSTARFKSSTANGFMRIALPPRRTASSIADASAPPVMKRTGTGGERRSAPSATVKPEPFPRSRSVTTRS